MKLSVSLAAIFIAVFSIPAHCSDQPETPKKSISGYQIKSVDLVLENNKKIWTSDGVVASYPDQVAVKTMIADELHKSLRAKGIYAEMQGESDAAIEVKLNYRRSFVVGSGVTYPYISFVLSGKDAHGQELASYQSDAGLLIGGGRKSIINDHKIMVGKYDQEEERDDIAAVANLISDAIAKMGN